MGAALQRLRSDPARWTWWGGLGLVLIPFVVSAGRLLFGVGGDYMPVQDLAVIEMFVRDVGHHPVLVGLYSRAAWSHPGPAEFYALAPFYWLTGDASVGANLGALTINAASVVGVAAIAGRRGGTPVLLCTLVGIALLTRTLGADFLADPWNTYAPVLPYLLMLFLTWSMLCGDLWALPVATVVASFVAQTHVGFVVLALPLLVVGAVALTLPELRGLRLRPRGRRGGEPGGPGEPGGSLASREPAGSDHEPGNAATDAGGGRAVGVLAGVGTREAVEVEAAGVPGVTGEARRRRTAVVRAMLLSAGLFALLWVPPVLDVLWHAPSNARLTIEWFQRAEEGVHTLGDGWKVITAQFDAKPEWVAGREDWAFATGEPKALYASAPVPVFLALVAAAAAVLWRRRVDGARALVATLGMALVLGIAGVARTVGPAYQYRLRWTWMPPMLAFVLVGWAGWRALVQRRPAAEARLLVPAAFAVLVALGAVNTTAAADAGIPYAADNAVMAKITPPVLEAFDGDHGGIGGDGQVVVDRAAETLGTHTYARGLLLQLERHGVDARVPAARIRFFPETRNQTEGPVRARLVVAADDQIDQMRDDPDYRMLSLWSPLTDEEQDDLLARMDQLHADYEAGRISQLEWLTEGGRLDSELFGENETVAYAVAVFLDLRVGDVSSSPST